MRDFAERLFAPDAPRGSRRRSPQTIEGEAVRIATTAGTGRAQPADGSMAPGGKRAMRPSEAAYRSGLFGIRPDAPQGRPARVMPEPVDQGEQDPDLIFPGEPGHAESILQGRRRSEGSRGRFWRKAAIAIVFLAAFAGIPALVASIPDASAASRVDTPHR